MKVRQPAVAGQFYDADGEQLEAHILALLEDNRGTAAAAPKVLISPHAGYMYSGAVAARAWGQLLVHPTATSRVVLFGPAHRVALEGMALPAAEAFRTPLGDLPLDQQGMAKAAHLAGFCISEEAHRLEHSLEVQLPFLQVVAPGASLLPVVVGRCAPQRVADAIDALWGGPETLLVISTDLSHFHSYSEALQLDRHTCQRLLSRDSGLSGQEACGAYALNGLMRSARARELEIELLTMCNSGDTGAGRDRVVGYAAFTLH